MGEPGMIAVTPAPRPGYQLRGSEPGPLSVSVVLAPHQSVVALLLQAVSGHSQGAPADLLASVRDALSPQARFAVQSFTGCGARMIPEACTPISPVADASVAEQAARLRDMPAATLTAELEAFDDGQPFLSQWRAAAEQPRRWLNSMAKASLDTWTVAEPRWRAAGPLLDREIRRVGTAAVRGAMPALLNSLHPRIRYHDGTFAFAPVWAPHQFQTLDPAGPRHLALVPMIAGRHQMLLSLDCPDVRWIGYPLPQPSPGAPAAADSALATILGPVRAAMLQALRQPLTVNGLAAAVHCAPTTATYHVRRLAEGGLITREKSGPAVWITRTVRGDELVDVLSD